MAAEYLPVLLTFALAAAVPALFLGASRLLRPRNPTAIKEEAFECGNPPSGTAWERFPVKFYLTAILFIVFDIEVVFMYPWAVRCRELGMAGLVEMALFVLVLAVGLLYAWRKGALEWE